MYRFSMMFAITVLPLCAAAQGVTVDWATKKVTSQPSTINQKTDVQVSVEHVNDVFYTYSVSATSVPASIDDFSTIAKAFGIAGLAAKGAGEAAGCDVSTFLSSVKELTDAETAFLNLPSTAPGCSAASPCSLTIAEALTSWNSAVAPKLATAKANQKASQSLCTATEYQAAYATTQHALDQADAIVASLNSSSHEAHGKVTLQPDFITTLEVDEFWNGKPTNKGQYTVTLSNSNSRLTLSAGALFSQIQNRSYTSVAVPSSSGTGTTNVLQVSGRSLFSPTALALLNYEIPKASTDTIGLAASSGPVFRLGSQSNTTSFGYFGGVSVHLYHRFYTSAGFHFGQFADYPSGFSAPGQTVPSGIATPTSVNRWTWRFGFAFTYKAKDFSAFGLGSSVAASVAPSTTQNGSKSQPSGGKKNSGVAPAPGSPIANPQQPPSSN